MLLAARVVAFTPEILLKAMLLFVLPAPDADVEILIVPCAAPVPAPLMFT